MRLMLMEIAYFILLQTYPVTSMLHHAPKRAELLRFHWRPDAIAPKLRRHNGTAYT